MFRPAHPVKSAAVEVPEQAGTAATSSLDMIDLARLWSVMTTYKYFIIKIILVSLLAAFLLIAILPSYYTAVTQILIDPIDLRVVENGLMPSSQMSEVTVLQAESQVRVLTSDNVLRRVITNEKLDSDPEFGGSQTSPLRIAVNAILVPLGLAHAAGRDPTLLALNALQRRVKAKRAERTYVVDVSVTTEDREKSARIANALAQAYLAEQTIARSEAARRASVSLLARLSELKNRVRIAEERVEEFKARNHILGASGQLVNEQQLSELNNQLTLARSRTAEARSRFEQVQQMQRSGAEAGAFTEAVQSQTMAALRSQYAEVVRREAEQTTSLGPRHPAVIEIHAQAQRLRKVIGEEVNRIAEAARNDYQRAKTSEDSLARSLEALKRNAISTNEAMVGLRELERDVQASRAVYESFLVRSRETGEQERLDTRNIRVISTADLPLRRSWPPSNLIMALTAIIFGMAGGTGLALLRDHRDRRARWPHAAEMPQGGEVWSEFPLLAVLPDFRGLHPLIGFEDPTSRPATEIRKLHDALRAGRKRWAGESILIIDPSDDGDTAAVAVNLAVVAAANQSVLLIDADIQQRVLSAFVSEQAKVGLIDVAGGLKRLADAVIRDPRTNINFIPLVSNKNASYREIKDEDIKVAFDLTKRFDLVIVAGSIYNGNPAGRFFAGLVDHIVLVANQDATHKREMTQLIAALGADIGKIRGTVLMGAYAG